MARDAFDVDADPYEGIDIVGIASEELFRGAHEGQNKWRENLDKGVGADGSHGRAYRNTGDTVNSITVEPKREGELEYQAGSDRIQAAVAETGRKPSPGNPPPFNAIGLWAKERGIITSVPEWQGGRSFMGMMSVWGDQEKEDALFIWHTMWKIAAEGLEGFAPGRKAGQESGKDMAKRARDRVEEAREEQSV